MLSKNTIKYIQSLKIKKYRQQNQAYIVEGEKCVTELLHSNIPVLAVYATMNWLEAYENDLRGKQSKAEAITEDELRKISDLTTPNKVLALAGITEYEPLQTIDFSDLILALDSIRDPGNMGTIIRTADWFGIRNIICSPDCVDFYNPKVIQSTMGSFARVKAHYIDLAYSISNAPTGTPIYGALLEGPLLTDKKFQKSGILLIGNESKGISNSLIPFITDPIYIPPFGHGHQNSYHAESLNASIANAIICYEIRKQLTENKL
jgi:RNA methyltransferase, TrmH family